MRRIREWLSRTLQKPLYKQLFAFLLILGCLFILATSVSVLTFQSVLKSKGRQRLISSYEIIPRSLDSLFKDFLSEPMEQLFHKPSIKTIAFTTKTHPAGELLTMEVYNDLQDFSSRLSLIDTTILFIPDADSFISTSNGKLRSITPDRKKYYDGLIYGYNSGTLKRSQLSDNNINTFLFRYDENYIISKDYTVKNGSVIATLFIMLNSKEFTNYLRSIYNFDTDYSIHIFDENNHPIMTSNSSINFSDPDELLRLQTSPSHTMEKDRQLMIYFPCDYLPWYSVVVTNKIADGLSTIYLLFAFSIGLMVTLLAFILITFKINHPLNVIVDKLKPYSDADGSSIYDFGEFGRAVSRMSERTDHLNSILSAASKDILTGLFSNLISGRSMPLDYLKTTLSASAYGFFMNNVYVSAALQYKFSTVSQTKTRYQIMKMVEHAMNEYVTQHSSCVYFVLPVDTRFYALILSFNEKTTISQGRQHIASIKGFVEGKMYAAGFPVQMEFGHIYHSILDVALSYHEAQKKHQCEVNISRLEPSEIITENEANGDSALDDASFNNVKIEEYDQMHERAEQITDMIKRDGVVDVEELVSRIISGLSQSLSFADQKRTALRLIGYLLEIMATSGLESPNNANDEYAELLELNADTLTPDDLSAKICEIIISLCERFDYFMKKRNHPLIAAAIGYIETNYKNPDLTLNSIAEYTKVAPNYLSNRFSKLTGKSLFSYITEYRISKSIELMMDNELDINAIAEQCGFGSSRNYIRHFKKYNGATPGAYRKQLLQTDK